MSIEIMINSAQKCDLSLLTHVRLNLCAMQGIYYRQILLGIQECFSLHEITKFHVTYEGVYDVDISSVVDEGFYRLGLSPS